MPSRKMMDAVVRAWVYGINRKLGSKKSEDNILYFHDNAIARKNANGTISINTCGYANHAATRAFINEALLHVYGEDAPYLYTHKRKVYMMHPETNEKNNWVENVNGDGWMEFSDTENYRRGWDSPSF